MRVRVDPVAAELVLPSQDAGAALQRVTLSIRDHARLYVAARALIPFPGSRLVRRTLIRQHHPTAWLALEEFVMAGRVGRQERFENVGLNLGVTVRGGRGESLCRDLWQLSPHEGGPGWGMFPGVWSLLLLAPASVTGAVTARVESLPDFAGWVELPHLSGILVKVMGSYERLTELSETIREWVQGFFFPLPEDGENGADEKVATVVAASLGAV